MLSDFKYSDFIYKYSNYLTHLIKSGLLNNEYSLFLLTEEYNKLKDLKFIRAEKIANFIDYGYDAWFVQTEDEYIYFRVATGIILVSRNERFIKVHFCQEFKRIGVFVPPAKDFVQGVRTFKDLADILKLKIDDIEVNWA